MTRTLTPIQGCGVIPPIRSNEQRMAALKRGNDIRSERSRFKRSLSAGQIDLAAMILDPPEWLHTAKVYEMLLKAPKIGRTKANKVILHARVSPSKTFAGLTARQRFELVAAYRDQVPALRQRLVAA